MTREVVFVSSGPAERKIAASTQRGSCHTSTFTHSPHTHARSLVMLLALRGVRTATQRSLRGGTAAAPTYAAAAVALPLLRQRMLSTSQARLARPVDKAAPKQDEAAAGNEASAEEASPSDAATAGKAERPTPAKKSATSAFDIDTSLSIASLPDPAKEGQAGAQRTGARARKNSTSTSQERQSKKMLTYLFGAGFIAAAGWTFGSLGAEWETIEERERYANVSCLLTRRCTALYRVYMCHVCLTVLAS